MHLNKYLCIFLICATKKEHVKSGRKFKMKQQSSKLNEEEMFLTSTRPTQLQAAVPVFTAPV
jgi:hypothetical protein